MRPDVRTGRTARRPCVDIRGRGAEQLVDQWPETADRSVPCGIEQAKTQLELVAVHEEPLFGTRDTEQFEQRSLRGEDLLRGTCGREPGSQMRHLELGVDCVEAE